MYECVYMCVYVYMLVCLCEYASVFTWGMWKV